MPDKQKITMSAFTVIEQGFKFNKERIYEMHRYLRQVACLKVCPGIDNNVALSIINDISDYLKKWEELGVYPSGIPVADDKIEAWVEAKSL